MTHPKCTYYGHEWKKVNLRTAQLPANYRYEKCAVCGETRTVSTHKSKPYYG